MANTLRFKRGLVSGIPTAALGEPLFTTDTFDLYIGNGTGNTRFQKYIASGTTSQLLRGDGSLLTMPIVLTSPSNGQVLKYDGTNWVNSADAGVTGSGANGQVTFWNSASTITGSNNLFWDATNNRLGINNATPAQAFDLVGNALIKGSGSTSATTALIVENNAGTDMALFRNNRSLSFISDAGQLNIFSSADATNGILELDANSSASQTIFVQLTRGTVGLATSGNQTAVRINGGFSPTSGTGTWHNLHINPVINQTGGANGITRAIYIQPSLTSAADWRSVEMNNNSGWGIYQSGASAKNYFAGNTLIGSTSDNGLRFQVTGDGFFSGAVGIGTSSISGFSLLINHAITTGAAVAASSVRSTIQSQVTTEWNSYQSLVGTQAATFTLSNLRHFAAQQSTFGAGSTVTNQFGFKVDGNLIGATNNFAFHSDLNSGTGRWNLYMNGTAANFLSGNLLINTTSSSGRLTVNGDNDQIFINTSGLFGSLYFNVSGNSRGALYVTDTTTRLEGRGTNGLILGGATSQSHLSIASNGSAIFSSTVRVNGTGSAVSITTTGDTSLWNQVTNVAGILYLGRDNSTGGSFGVANGHIIYGSGTNPMAFFTNTIERFRITSGGNLLVNTTTDAGFRLDVNGTMRVSGASTFGSTISAAGQITGASGATEGKFNFLGYNGAYGGILSNTGFSSSYNAVYLYSNFNAARNGQGNSALPSYFLELGGATPNNDSFSIQRSAAGSFTFSNLFKVDGTGAATFSSSVTATSYNATTQNIFSVGGTEGMRLTATNRNLHIGTFSSDSGEKLQVVGNAKIGTYSTTGYSLVVQNNGANDVSGIRISTGATVDGYLSLAYDATNTYGSIQAGDNNVFRNIVINRQGGSVGIGANPNNSAVLQADSTTRGFLPPRMTTTQRNAIPTPAAGLIVYDTTDNKHYGYNGTTWNAFY